LDDYLYKNPEFEGVEETQSPSVFGKVVPKYKPVVQRTKEAAEVAIESEANHSAERVSHALHKMLMKARRLRIRALKNAAKQKEQQYWAVERPMQELAHPSFWTQAAPKVTHPPRYFDELTDNYENIWKHADIDSHIGRRRLDFKIRNHFVPRSKWTKVKLQAEDFFSRFGNTEELYKHPNVDIFRI